MAGSSHTPLLSFSHSCSRLYSPRELSTLRRGGTGLIGVMQKRATSKLRRCAPRNLQKVAKFAPPGGGVAGALSHGGVRHPRPYQSVQKGEHERSSMERAFTAPPPAWEATIAMVPPDPLCALPRVAQRQKK